MSVKGALVFVGKSVAFALISGLIWSLFMVFIASFSTRYRSNSSSDNESARVAEQMDAYEKQSREVQEQLERTARQQERAATLLDTQERLYAEQEQLQKRFANILDKWERVPSK
jgi:hypothetical protein